MDFDERRLFLKGLAVGVAGGLSGVIQQVLAADAPASGIQRLKGEVTINGASAKEGAVIKRGDVVATAADSEVVYVIGRDAFVQRADTRVSFAGDATASFMRVVTGGLLSVFGRGSKKITLPTATIGIRGTGCYIETEPARSYFCLCFGDVLLRPMKGKPLRYKTRHHENPLWIEKGATTKAGVINHTDAEIIMLETLVGRGSPFPAGTYRY
jgi:hypothetical protein